MAWCQGCGRIIVFAKSVDGKTIPLDPKAPVYRVIERDDWPEAAEPRILVERTTTAMVNHHSTCPKINEAPWKRKPEVDRTEPGGTQG